MPQQNILKGDEGHTLVEVVTAMALLLTVMLPLTLTVGFAMDQRHARDVSEALIMAQGAMEDAIGGVTEGSYEKSEGRWTIILGRNTQGEIEWIDVTVRRAGRDRPLVTLRTARGGGVHEHSGMRS
jgi:hypothetical protein